MAAPAPPGGPPLHPLTQARLQEATDEEFLERAEKLDMIFERITSTDGLAECVNLRELCLINTPGLVVPDLSFARHLSRVTLTDQRLVSLTQGGPAGLGALPHLRELYLQNNQLQRMDGLQGCTGLHKLWLCCNHLCQLEGLTKLPDLRELWLQDNSFEDVAAGPGGAGLSACINLQVLALAGNPLTQCESLGLTVLSALPALHDLSFADPMFGDSPVVRTSGYRDSVIMQCRQVQMLDGVRVTGGARAEAEDGYLRSVLEFNARIDGIRQAAAADAAAAERRLVRNQEAHEAHKASLTREWEQLVGSVVKAQGEMAAARDELVATAATRRADLQAQALALTRENDAAIGQQVALTEEAMEAEDRRLSRLESLLTLQEDFEIHLGALQGRGLAPEPAPEVGAAATAGLVAEHGWSWVSLPRGGRGYREAARAWAEAAGAAAAEDREVFAAYRLDRLSPVVADISTGGGGEPAAGEGEWVAFLGSGAAGGEDEVQGGWDWSEVKTVVSEGWQGWLEQYGAGGDGGCAVRASVDSDASAGAAGARTLAVYRRLPAATADEARAPGAVAVLGRLRVAGGCAVHLEAADADYLSPAELAAEIPQDADWGGVEGGDEGGAYLLLAAHAAGRAGGPGRGPEATLAGLSATYCVLLSEPGLEEAESGGVGALVVGGLSPAVAETCAAIEARAAALERLAGQQWREYLS